MSLVNLGALAFGFVIGWICYRTLRRKTGGAALSDIATVSGAIGGGAVVSLFKSEELFAWYSIGLVIGFIGYLAIGLLLGGRASTNDWMGSP